MARLIHSRLYKLLLAFAGASALGILGAAWVATEPVGYAAGYGYMFGLLVIGALEVVLLVLCVVFLLIPRNTKGVALALLTGMVVLPFAFFTGALLIRNPRWARDAQAIDKFPAEETDLVILLKADITEQQISKFWHSTLSTPAQDGGNWSLPGIEDTARLGAQDGHPVIAIRFFPEATPQQLDAVKARIAASPLVFRVKQHAPRAELEPSPTIAVPRGTSRSISTPYP